MPRLVAPAVPLVALALVLVSSASPAVRAWQAAAEAPAVEGTWNISLQGHPIALVLEQKGEAVTGTLMIMGKDVPVEGTFAGRALKLTGPAAVGEHGSEGKTVPLQLVATLQADDTLEGELTTARGPMKWTAERLKPE
jgi:hypothetical protein